MNDLAKLLIIMSLLFISNDIFSQKENQPNIVLFFADDAGYKDFGFTGSKEFQSPYIDKLADEGVVFTNAYVSAAVCGPSRAGLLTGMYQQRFGFIYNNVPNAIDTLAGLYGEEMGLPKDQLTIANHLSDYGYKSSIIGKWHQGHGDGFHPLDRGFDHFYGFLGGARSFFEMSPDPGQPAWKILNEESRLWHNRKQIEEPGGYLTDVFGDEACSFIEDNQASPFFLYLSFNAVHTPLEAKKADLERFPKLEGNRKKLAAMTWSMDEAIGKVCAKIKDLGLEDNTIIIFTNDNGGTSYHGRDNSQFSGCKGNYLEGGIRVPFVMKWKGQLKPVTYEYLITTRDIVPTSIGLAGGDLSQHTSFDGVNIMPYIQGEKDGRPHQTLYWNGDGRFFAIRDGDWKLISLPDRLPELYDLSNDISEQNNVAQDFPEITKGLVKKLFEWSNVIRG
ncbi:MAG: sulfatase-like hydrolase/transferase [Bacteroidetes bacterium]|nr:sulfatase-like hydrolase/transferase [Bacteroidota bacterium]